jgi:hypothetical protein
MSSAGQISIASAADVSNPSTILPTKITITAEQIDLSNGEITAAATGNVPASAIDINYGASLLMDPSTISTSSVNGNGGPIMITGQGPLFINQSNITTSVSGTTNGNGGNIDINVPFIIMDTAAIQANTQAALASGGDITIKTDAVIPSFSSFVAGGPVKSFDAGLAGLNLVQAAAPQGISGALNFTLPTLDIGSSLLGLAGRPAVPTPLGRSLCGFTRGSSLAVAGRGGLPNSAYDPLWVDVDDRSEPAAQKLDHLPSHLSRALFLYAGNPPCRW